QCGRPAGVAAREAEAPVAQLDRAPDYESGGQRFESFRARQFSTPDLADDVMARGRSRSLPGHADGGGKDVISCPRDLQRAAFSRYKSERKFSVRLGRTIRCSMSAKPCGA